MKGTSLIYTFLWIFIGMVKGMCGNIKSKCNLIHKIICSAILLSEMVLNNGMSFVNKKSYFLKEIEMLPWSLIWVLDKVGMGVRMNLMGTSSTLLSLFELV